MTHCPRCAAPAAASQAACGKCGFSLEALLAAMSTDLIQLQHLADDANCLRLHEKRDLEAVIESFERRFPQVCFIAYFGVLPVTMSVSELAFLLLNRGVLAARGGSRLNEHAVALVIDPVTRHAGLMVGYALEAFFPPRLLTKFLHNIRTQLWHGEYAAAAGSALRMIERRLRKFAQRDQRQQALPPLNAEEFLAASGFQSLRPAPSARGTSASAVLDGTLLPGEEPPLAK